MEDADVATYEQLWAHVEPANSRRLLLAALEAFAVHGFEGATTRDIATRAGLSPAAVYVHYRTKRDLLGEIARIGHEAVLAEVVGAVAAYDEPSERLRAFVEAFVSWHARFNTLARVTQYELAALSPEQAKVVLPLRQRFERLVEAELQRGVDAGTFVVPDSRGTAIAILSLGIDVARWYTSRGRDTPEQIARLYGSLVVRMVAA